MHPIPYSRQQLDEDDIAAVVAVLRSDFLTQGPSVGLFETALAHYCGAPHAVAIASGTAGLHLACLALGIGVGDSVWTSPISFVASANCARYVGATVGFVDCDPHTGLMDLDALQEKLRAARKQGTLPKLLIVVHFAGHACDMARIGKLAREYGFYVIEDAAHALGATHGGKPVGSGAHSDMTLFSFHPVKSITSGEGGALLLNDAALAGRLRQLRTHGITRDTKRMATAGEGVWMYEMQELGYHYRMTDMQAALGTSQLKKLDGFIARRRQLASRYHTLLAPLGIGLPVADATSAWHLYVVRLGARRREIFDGMRAHGIGVNVHYIPIHWQPYYQRLGFARGDFPGAEQFYAGALSLPLFPGLSDAQQDQVVATLAQLLRG